MPTCGRWGVHIGSLPILPSLRHGAFCGLKPIRIYIQMMTSLDKLFIAK